MVDYRQRCLILHRKNTRKSSKVLLIVLIPRIYVQCVTKKIGKIKSNAGEQPVNENKRKTAHLKRRDF